MIVVINTFAWVFVLSSVIPPVILGKKRSILVQFFICLILTVISFVILDTIQTMGGPLLDQLHRATFLFSTPFFAVLHVSLPYIALFFIDWRVKKKEKKLKKLEEINREYMENAAADKADEVKDTEQLSDKQSDQHAVHERLKKRNLYSAHAKN